MIDPTRTLARTCAYGIAEMRADSESPAVVCVVIATQGTGRAGLEIDASTVMMGAGAPPELLLEFARRLRPAIEAVARDLAQDRGQSFARRHDLERELGERDADGGGEVPS